MGNITVILLAIGVAMDAFAVSITNGICYKDFKKFHMILTAITFGLFQAFMPILGYLIGNSFYDTIAFIDHWIALILLSIIGINMLVEGIQSLKKNVHACKVQSFGLKVLLIQGIATSIDALAVGISIAVTKTNIITSSIYIGIITSFLCFFGCLLGKKFDALLKEKAEIFGGIVLIGIGFKIFIEHIFL